MAPPEVVSTVPLPVLAAFKEIPILFSAPMARATLREVDPKTQTRRVVKGLSEKMWLEESAKGGFNVCYDGAPCCGTGAWEVAEHSHPIACPYGRPGDRMWGRETFFAWGRWETRFSEKKKRDEWHFVDLTLDAGREYLYAADDDMDLALPSRSGGVVQYWKRPAIFMPRIASRILLEVTGVRVERLQDISEADAEAEGCAPREPSMASGMAVPGAYRLGYRDLWELINGAGSWAVNPWVWAVEFRRIRP